MYSSADARSGSTYELRTVLSGIANQVLGSGGLATFLAGSGAMHFVIPKYVDGVVPGWLPGSARFWTYGSGIAELVVAGAVAHPRFRRAGAFAAAGMFAAVLPGNVKLAIDSRKRPMPIKLAAYARLPLQIPMVMWGLKVAQRAVA